MSSALMFFSTTRKRGTNSSTKLGMSMRHRCSLWILWQKEKKKSENKGMHTHSPSKPKNFNKHCQTKKWWLIFWDCSGVFIMEEASEITVKQKFIVKLWKNSNVGTEKKKKKNQAIVQMLDFGWRLHWEAKKEVFVYKKIVSDFLWTNWKLTFN